MMRLLGALHSSGLGRSSNTPGFTAHSWPYILTQKLNPPESGKSSTGSTPLLRTHLTGC
jgi:hypothetical protein